ncbi:MAG: hypothetical protein ACPGEC_01780 [Flavobacteriales bacterium]
MFSAENSDLVIFDSYEFRFYDYFYAILSSVLGLSTSIWLWIDVKKTNQRNVRLFKRYASLNAQLILWIVLLCFTRFCFVISIVLYGTKSYSQHLNLHQDYWIIFVLIPLALFLQNWYIVRLFYRIGKWFVLSLLACIAFSVILCSTLSVDQDIINKAYFNDFKNDYNYIDNQINIAKSKYNINFSEATITALKQKHSDANYAQVLDAKSVLSHTEPAPLEVIILQKIMIHNFKPSVKYDWRSDKWYYAHPQSILNQLQHHTPRSAESYELIQVLIEQYDLLHNNLKQEDWQKNSYAERRRSYISRYNFRNVDKQLQIVFKELIEQPKYSKFHPELLKRYRPKT